MKICISEYDINVLDFYKTNYNKGGLIEATLLHAISGNTNTVAEWRLHNEENFLWPMDLPFLRSHKKIQTFDKNCRAGGKASAQFLFYSYACGEHCYAKRISSLHSKLLEEIFNFISKNVWTIQIHSCSRISEKWNGSHSRDHQQEMQKTMALRHLASCRWGKNCRCSTLRRADSKISRKIYCQRYAHETSQALQACCIFSRFSTFSAGIDWRVGCSKRILRTTARRGSFKIVRAYLSEKRRGGFYDKQTPDYQQTSSIRTVRSKLFRQGGV